MRDGIAERLASVVVEVRRGVLDPPERRDLDLVCKEGAGNGEWRGHGRMAGSRTSVGCKRSPRSGDWIVTTGFTPSLMIHVRIGLWGAVTMFTPVPMKRTPGRGRPPPKSECTWLTVFNIGPL